MRKIYWWAGVILAGVLMFSGCYKDDIDDLEKRQKELEKQQAEFEERLADLESWKTTTNNAISTLKDLIDAMEKQDHITEVIELTESGAVVGYVIKFKIADPVTIYHGEDGSHGSHGSTPVISVKEEGGVFYWTMQIGDGEPTWILCPKGNKICASGSQGLSAYQEACENGFEGSYEEWLESFKGEDGKDGKDGSTPVLGLKEVDGVYYWTYKVGNGPEEFMTDSAGNKVPATGPKGDQGEKGEDGKDGEKGKDGENGKDGKDGDSFFQGVDHKSSPDYVVFTLSDGTEITIPKYKGAGITFTSPAAMDPKATVEVPFEKVNGATDVWVLQTTGGWNVSVEGDNFVVTAPDKFDSSGKALILVSCDANGETSTYTLTFRTRGKTTEDLRPGEIYTENESALGIVIRAKTPEKNGLILYKGEKRGKWEKVKKDAPAQWKLPTVEELEETYNVWKSQKNEFNARLKQIEGDEIQNKFYWSSVRKHGDDEYWGVSFSNGSRTTNDEDDSELARYVREF